MSIRVRVTTFLEFLETWKCQRIGLKSGKRPEVGQGICVVRDLRQLNKITYLCSICTVIHFSYVFFAKFWIKNSHLFNIACNFVSKSPGKSEIFFCLESGNRQLCTIKMSVL